MGIRAPISAEILKKRKASLVADTERLWQTYLGDFPMLQRYRVDAKYVVSIDAIMNDDGSNVWVSDVQDFFTGQEVEILEHIEYAATEFGASHILVCIRDFSGFIENSVTVGDILC